MRPRWKGRRSNSASSRSVPGSTPRARAANNFVLNSYQLLAARTLAWLKLVERSLGIISSMDDKIVAGLKDANGLLAAYREALEKFMANTKLVEELVTEMSGSAGAIMQGGDRDEG